MRQQIEGRPVTPLQIIEQNRNGPTLRQRAQEIPVLIEERVSARRPRATAHPIRGFAVHELGHIRAGSAELRQEVPKRSIWPLPGQAFDAAEDNRQGLRLNGL